MSNSLLFNILFPSKSFKIEQYDVYKKVIPTLHEKIETIENERDFFRKRSYSIIGALIENPDNIISIHKTHKGFDIILAYRLYEPNNPVLIIRIWHMDNFNKCGQDLILNARILSDGQTVIIDDITSLEYNKGFGHTAILKLIEISKNKGCKEIVGDLEYGDLNTHRERLFHFYNKLGFTIQMNDNKTKGKIKLKI